MGTKQGKKSTKAQVGMGLLIAGVILAVPGISNIVRGSVVPGLMLLIIPAGLIIGGSVLKKSGAG